LVITVIHKDVTLVCAFEPGSRVNKYQYLNIDQRVTRKTITFD